MAVPTDSIAVHARLTPNRPAASDLSGGLTLTYAELDAHVARIAGRLLACGCGPGDRVAAMGLNSVWLVALAFACARAGLIFVPLNWRLRIEELAPLVQLAEPRIVLGDASPAALTLAAVLDVIPLGDFLAESALAEPIRKCARDPDRASLILFTSGTSGRPKGVVLTERNQAQTAINFALLTQVDRHSAFLCDAPMFHVIGLGANVRPVLHQGGRILVSDGFDAARTLARLTDPALGITHYVGVPQMIEAFRRVDGFRPSALRHLTGLVSGGAPHARNDLETWLAEDVPIVLGFGMSEAGTVFGMSTDLATIRSKPGSAGIASPAVETRVVDPDGRDLAAGQAGELLLRGDTVTPGYWRNPDETAKAIDADGWFRTGDIVSHDEDGFFWIVGRRKDMFISGGENVYPSEIELALSGYPGILECALVGVPDGTWGEVGHLVVVPDPGRGFDEAQVRAFLAARLAAYKAPKHVSLVEALPRTSTGKVQKEVLREFCRNADRRD